MAENTQQLLTKIRPPRVQITYDVETGDAIIMKQLPFIVGVLADLAGVPENTPPKLKDRKFVEIDMDSFNEVMGKIAPRLPLRVPNVLDNQGGELNILLNFATMDDFNPVNVAKQIPALAQLLDARERLSNLLAKLDGNDTLDSLLQEVAHSTDLQKELQTDIQQEDTQPGTSSPSA